MPTADELAVERAVGDAARLRAAASALAGEQRALGPALRRIADDHAEHLAALGAAGATPTPTRTDGGRQGLPDDAGGLRDAEWSAARAALRDALTADGDLAVLLARIAAARAVHADVAASVSGSGPPALLSPAAAPTGTAAAVPTPSPGESGPTAPAQAQLAALTRLLAGEHAAVFAYPIVIARCAGSRRAAAESLWRAHVAERDALERLLEAAGVDPPGAAPAYDVGPVPTDPGGAARLAADVETGLAGLAAAAVRDATGAARLHAARQLVSAARRSATWGRSPGALPGGAV